MSDEVVSVCSECHEPLVRVEHPERPGLVTFECPDHGQRGFVLDGGQVEIDGFVLDGGR